MQFNHKKRINSVRLRKLFHNEKQAKNGRKTKNLQDENMNFNYVKLMDADAKIKPNSK